MSYADFLANPFAVREFGEWYFEVDVTQPGGGLKTLRYSRWGTPSDKNGATIIVPGTGVDLGSYVIPDNTAYPKRILDAPYYKQAVWNGTIIGGQSIPSYGQLTLNNMDEGLTQYSPDNGYIWANATFRVFFFDSRDLSGTIGVVGVGVVGSAKFANGRVTVDLLGFESTFSQPLSQRVYRGTGFMCELAAGTGTEHAIAVASGAGAAATAVNITGDVTVSAWVWIEALPSSAVVILGWDNTPSPYRFRLLSSGAIGFAVTIAGASQFATTVATLNTKQWYHITGVISGTDVRFEIFDEVFWSLTTETYTNAFTASPRDTVTTTSNFVIQSAAGATVWFDEVRVWNVARSSDDLASTRFAEIPDGSIPSSLVYYARMNDGSGTTVTDSGAHGYNATLSGSGTATSTWLHSMEGGPDLAGTPKPDAYGDCFGCKPVCVCPQYEVWQAAGAYAISSFQYIREGGNPLTIDSDAASFRAFIVQAMNTGVGATAGGHAYTYKGRGLAKLGRHPTLPLSMDIHGYLSARGTGSYIYKAADIIQDAASFRGLWSGGYDTTAIAAFNTAAPYTQGAFIADPTQLTLASFFSKLCAGCGLASWGFTRGSSVLGIWQFVIPAISSFDFDDSHIVSYGELDTSASVIYLINLQYNQNAVALGPTDIAALLLGTSFSPGTIGLPSIASLQSSYLTQPSLSQATRTAYPGKSSQQYTVSTYLRSSTDAKTVADLYRSILAGSHRAYQASLSQPGREVTFTNGITLKATDISGDILDNLDGATVFVVLSVEDRKQDGVINLQVWK